MVALYLVGGLLVIVTHAGQVADVLALVVREALLPPGRAWGEPPGWGS